jgi:hypothetical protein
MNNVQIPVSLQADGSITPNPMGPGMATVLYNTDANGVKTAIIAFAGHNQALVTFDDFGRQVVSYTPFNQMMTPSIENIIRHINQMVH